MAPSAEASSVPRSIMRRLRYAAWPPPEPELAHAGRAGEIVIARARLFVVSLLLLPALASCIRAPSQPSGWIALGMALTCIAIGVGILSHVRKAQTGHTLQLATTLMDISLVSIYHVLLFLAGQFDMVFNSRVTYCLYVIAVIGTALRYDGQLVRLAGLTAIVQYLAIVEWANLSMRLESIGAAFYGDTSLGGQLEEVCIVLIATVLGAIIVERARELRLSGIRDPLTHLTNRSYFFDRFHLELQDAIRSKRPIAVAMIDIDHFKQVNDTYGHTAGDKVLTRVATEMRRSLAQSGHRNSVIARLGGEEFAILLNDAPAETARSIFESLRTGLHALHIAVTDAASVQITVSIGIAMSPSDGLDMTKLLEVSDARLLAGKRAGRDMVVSSD